MAPRTADEKMCRNVFLCCGVLLLATVVTVFAKEEVTVVLAPNSTRITSIEPLQSSDIGNVVNAILGFTVRPINWHSLAPGNPLHQPELCLFLHFSGFESSMKLGMGEVSFPLENQEDIDEQFSIISQEVYRHYPGEKSVLLHFDANEPLYSEKSLYPVLLKDVPADVEERRAMAVADKQLGRPFAEGTFNLSQPGDSDLATELYTVKLIANSIHDRQSALNKGAPSVFWMKVSGLRLLVDRYGVDSYPVQEGVRMIRQCVAEVTTSIQYVKKGKALIVAITDNDKPTTLSRRGRSLLADPVPPTPVDYNIATRWNPDFDAMFAIITFVMIAMSLAVLAVSVAMWNMDPGRDSIIYRMTSQWRKKD